MKTRHEQMIDVVRATANPEVRLRKAVAWLASEAELFKTGYSTLACDEFANFVLAMVDVAQREYTR